jgi:hypothetical protein
VVLNFVVGRMLAVLNVPADKLDLNAGDKPRKKRGRPPNPINDYFTNMVFDKSQGRWSVTCKLCGDCMTASQATLDGKRSHLQKCTKVTPDIHQLLTQQHAAKVNQEAAAAAAATTAVAAATTAVAAAAGRWCEPPCAAALSTAAVV